MAKTALRVYNREIEELIEHEQIEEAIAHCRHILKMLPKHVATYRLLGKAYLEDQRYGDAADLFQRVLSAIPDDFIAHVGMSIIREDEGNIDASIWHMERAFEGQPSNQAIQGELRRLYGRRDGLEPPKIRLTRGALARMYAHGDLYEQAIAELQAALAEDPQRPDLQVLLAEMYFNSEKPVDAAETCTLLLDKLPNCLEANRLLAEILKDSERAEEMKAHQRRVQALEPYAAYTTASVTDPVNVPDEAVTIERLEWQPGKLVEEEEIPWKSSLGIKRGDEVAAEEDELPEWLASAEEEGDLRELLSDEEDDEAIEPAPAAAATADKTAESSVEEMTTAPQVAEAIEASESEEEEAAAPETTMEEVTKEDEGELARAEIPDWLKDLQPEEIDESAAEEVAAAVEEELPEWLKEMSEAEEHVPAEAESTAPSDDEEKAAMAWLESVAADQGVREEEEVELPDSEDAPDWPQEAVENEEAVEAAPIDFEEDEVPSWLDEAEEPAPLSETEATPTDEAPDWLKALGEDEEPSAEEAAMPAFEAEGIDEDLAQLEDVDAETEMELPTTEERDEEAPAWADEAIPSEAASETVEPGPEEITTEEDPLGWLRELSEEAGQAEATDEETPDWLAELTEDTAPAAEETASEAPEAEEEPDWLREISGEAELAEEDEEVGETVAASEEIPDWLKELSEEAKKTGALILAQAEEAPEDSGEAASWLEDLAAEEGISEEELPPSSEEPAVDAPPTEEAEAPAVESSEIEETPTWQGQLDEDEGPPAEIVGIEVEDLPLPEEEAPEEELLPETELPEWLPEASLEAARAEEEAEAVVEEEVGTSAPEPDWTEEEAVSESMHLPSEAPPTLEEEATQKKSEPEEQLAGARKALNIGQLVDAVEGYSKLIKRGRLTDEIISDLEAALNKHPVNVGLWQTLGDAYMRADRLQEALDSYTKAEELLR